MARPLRTSPTLLLAAALLLAGCASEAASPVEPAGVVHIEPDDATGTSMATVVRDGPLVHTDQLLPVDASGAVAGRGDPEAQTRRLVEQLRAALEAAGADLGGLAKLNVYLAEDAFRERVLAVLAERLPDDARPAVSFVTGEMPLADALVAMDAVAAAPGAGTDGEVAFFRAGALHAGSGQAHAALLPAGGRVYVSGQAERGEGLDAVGETMVSLHATLAYLGLSVYDVVQVKAFVNTMAEAAAVEERIEAYYPQRPAPPVVLVEWRQDDFPAEIELIASAGASNGPASGDALSYVTPPGMSSSPTFSRVVEVKRGDLVYVSGLYGQPGQDDAAQVRELFDALERVLGEAGSDVDHLVKATYYQTTDGASRALNDIRRSLYDPERPPAASKISVRGVGREGATVTLDMIAVVPER